MGVPAEWAYHVAFTREQLKDGKFVEAGKFAFDDNKLTVTASNGCAPEYPTGTYVVVLTKQGDEVTGLSFKPVHEPCPNRTQSLSQSVLPKIKPGVKVSTSIEPTAHAAHGAGGCARPHQTARCGCATIAEHRRINIMRRSVFVYQARVRIAVLTSAESCE